MKPTTAEQLRTAATWSDCADVRTPAPAGTRSLFGISLSSVDADAVTERHVETILPLVLAHRSGHHRSHEPSKGRSSAPGVEPPGGTERDDRSASDRDAAGPVMPDRVFAARDVPAPRIVVRSGVEVYGPEQLDWRNARAYYFYDPDGNLLEFWSPL